jgi:hypothetical protein
MHASSQGHIAAPSSLEEQPSVRHARLPVAAILLASLLGLALACCAGTLMPLVAGQHAAGAVFPDAGSRGGDICSGSASSNSSKAKAIR